MAIGELEFLHIAKKRRFFHLNSVLKNGIINAIEIFSKQFEINADPLIPQNMVLFFSAITSY